MKMFNKFCILILTFISIAHSAKITLFDSSKVKDDLNWSKISFKETVQSSSIKNSDDWLKDRLSSFNSKNELHGWKESSFSQSGGDDVWRIHFVCDLNIQNIQNWLFTPLINTKTANRVTLNLTFTIRECEHFPIKQVVKNCREKFELYYEESQANDQDDLFLNDDDYLLDQNNQNKSSVYFLNKIKQLRFRDTFVSDTGLRYYNSVVDRQKQQNHHSNRPGESMINVELREIPLSINKPDSYVRFAIRDTGACISLLSVEVSYVTCSSFTKHGIYFPETPTGRDLTDLVQVNGKCPDYSLNTQQPKAICTAKGEWLITDSNLANRCMCIQGYEFINDKCIPCQIGYFKSSIGNEMTCQACPENSWSSQPGSARCECLSDYYKENENDLSSPCKAIQPVKANNLNIEFLNDEKINISLNRFTMDTFLSAKIQTDLKCFQCDTNSAVTSYSISNCDTNCFVLSSANDWIVILNRNLNQNAKLKIILKQKLNDRELTQTSLYVYLKQEKHFQSDISKYKLIDETIDSPSNEPSIKCDLTHQQNSQSTLVSLNEDYKRETDANKGLCVNMTLNLNSILENLFAKYDLIAKIKRNLLLNIDFYALLLNNDYQLIPLNSNSIQTNYLQSSSSIKSSYIKLLNSNQNIKSYLLNKTSLFPLVLCNHNQIEKLKLKLEFESSFEPNSFLNLINNNLEIFTIDIKISDVCNVKEVNKKSLQLITNHALYNLREANVNNLQQLDMVDGNSAPNSFKIHVLLPVLLSFCLVFFIFILAIFLRKVRFRQTKSKNFHNCEKNFIPVLGKKCSSKCKNCSTHTNTSSCSSTTSSSPSTICTTSQIIERESKLYYVDPHTYEDPTLAVQEFAQEISPLDIKIESVIGGGEFGDVCKGKLKNGNNLWVTVAIKTLKVGSSEKNRCDFLTEASIMAQFHHENIICLEGVVTQSHPYMIITEYMDNGSLDTFLRLNSWRLDIFDSIKMLRDIANGMKYLSEMNFVHRDLAARNILVDKDLKCKVADFGLSREIEGTNTEGVYWTKGGKIPVRWTAPEAITHTKFTCSSDVWSFGVVMWEVMSYGERPYWNWSNTDVIKAVDKGFRLFIPPNCPQILYNMMLDCWEADRLKRPKFKKIVSELDALIKSKKECFYIPNKSSKQTSYIDTNRPNFTHLTNIHEWLNSLSLIEYVDCFIFNRYLNLSQVLNLEVEDLILMEIFDQNHQMIMLESLKRIQFELNFQNGFLV